MDTKQLNKTIESNPDAPSAIIQAYLREIGAKGGKAGKGEAKRRDAGHYARMGKMAAEKRWAGHVKAIKGKTGEVIATICLIIMWFSIGYGLAAGY